MREPKEKTRPEPSANGILYSVVDAARLLSISPRHLWSYVAAGEIPTRTIGRRRLIHRRELERFAARDHAEVGEK